MASEEYDWKDESQCSLPYNQQYVDYFFSEEPEEIAVAKELCSICPVRKECLQTALNNKEVWGIWGGRDEVEIRNTLSLNSDSQEVRRLREGIAPICLNCEAPTEALSIEEVDVPGGGRWTTKKVVTCSECGFNWSSRTSSNAIEAYMTGITKF